MGINIFSGMTKMLIICMPIILLLQKKNNLIVILRILENVIQGQVIIIKFYLQDAAIVSNKHIKTLLSCNVAYIERRPYFNISKRSNISNPAWLYYTLYLPVYHD